MTRALGIILIVIGALGCGSQLPEGPYYVVRDSSGIEIVENQDHGTALSLGPLLYRIGNVDGPGALYRVSHTFLTSDGGVAIVESSLTSYACMVPTANRSDRSVAQVAARGNSQASGGQRWDLLIP